MFTQQVLKGEANEEERKLATQLRGPLMPVQQPAPKSIARTITEDEKNFNAYLYLRGVSHFILFLCLWYKRCLVRLCLFILLCNDTF